MSILDDNETLMNDSENQVYKNMIHKEIEWNPNEHQSFYNFREWMKTNIYKFNDDIGRIDEEISRLRYGVYEEIFSLQHQITQLEYRITQLESKL